MLVQKIVRYEKFWSLKDVKRPLIAVDLGGFFPLQSYRSFRSNGILEPEWIDPANYPPDYEEILAAGNLIADDAVRGVCPITTIPWMEAILGCTVKVDSSSIWAEEKKIEIGELSSVEIGSQNAWYLKYLEFLDVLQRHFRGRAPVGLPILRGTTDIAGALRGHGEILMDLSCESGEADELLSACTEAFISVVKAHYEVTESFCGGYYVEQFSLWAPDRIVRMQEDNSAIYSPMLFERHILEKDRRIAASFPCSVMHLHPASLFLLDQFLKIREIDVFQVNKDLVGMSVRELLPYLQRIQADNRKLLIRGALKEEDFETLSANLSPRGLMIQIVCDRSGNVDRLLKRSVTYW